MGIRPSSLENMDVISGIPSAKFWRGKRVLLTGHTGFKGAWLAIWLHRLGAQVVGLSLPPKYTPNLFTLARVETLLQSHFVDIRDAAATAELINASKAEIVFHLAAQALVRTGYRVPLETFSVNVMGTGHVLDALRSLDGVRAVVAVTTDKVYKNLEHVYPYRETDELGGHDPYSASKAAAEMLIACYRDSFLKENGVAVASARAGNVIGGGDWSEDRLIPDAVRAWQTGQVLVIRRPRAIRPWQHVLEPLAGYLTLAQKLWQQPELAGAYNFGPQTNEVATVREVIELARTAYGDGKVTYDEITKGPHEAGWLALEIAKARLSLGVSPRWTLSESVNQTIAWYRAQHSGTNVLELTEAGIVAFEALG